MAPLQLMHVLLYLPVLYMIIATQGNINGYFSAHYTSGYADIGYPATDSVRVRHILRQMV